MIRFAPLDAAPGQARRWALLIIFAVGAFHLTTIRPGHNWGDDFGMYIHHARNIAEGKPYADTGYIPNPRNVLGPVTYPPVFPLLLAPVYQLWGLNLTAMKVELILFFLLSLVAISLAFKNELSGRPLAALIAIIGFNPQFWLGKDSITSDLPFLFFAYLSFYFIHEASRPGRTRALQVIHTLSMGISICLAFGTRAVGLALIPCPIISYALRDKKPGRRRIAALLLTAAALLMLLTSSQIIGAYASHFGINSMNAAGANLLGLIQSLSEYWDNGFSRLIWLALFALLSGLAVIGYLARIRKGRITCFEIVVPFYLAPFLLLPISLDRRFMMPIIPIYIFHAFGGIQTISALAGDRRQAAERWAFTAATIAILASYAGRYAGLDFGPIRNGVTSSEARQLFDYVEKEIGNNEVIIFRKPRALSLFTRRTAAVWHYSESEEGLWDFFRQVNASYLIIGPDDVEPESQRYIRNFVDRNRAWLRETFVNADFRVYRIVSGRRYGALHMHAPWLRVSAEG